MIVTILGSLIVCALLTLVELPFLTKLKAGQTVREEGPQSHLAKTGTPTMGGISIILTLVIGMILLGYNAPAFWVIILGVVSFGLLGFVDDFKKVKKKQNLGLTAGQKIIGQIIFALVIAILVYIVKGSLVLVPFLNEFVDFGFFYIPFAVFVIVAMVNAVNLTDGLDGLASGTSAIVSLFFMILGFGASSEAMNVLIPFYAGLNMFALIVGACLGFLVFNKKPAKLFMGDTGSLALGGGITVAALMMGLELLLPIVGFVFVAEALSVVIQVVSFKKTGKRVFRMAPLHHHFEEGGWSEWKVVLVFWGATAAFCVIGLLICLI